MFAQGHRCWRVLTRVGVALVFVLVLGPALSRSEPPSAVTAASRPRSGGEVALGDIPEALARQQPDAPREPVKSLILPGESFLVADRPSFILWPEPKLRQKPQPWVCYAPTLPPYPDEHEKWMHQRFLEAGVAVCGIDVGEAYGSPQGQEWFTKLYEELTEKRGFARQPCLLGRSRGGLWVTAWAARHPDRVAGLAGIYPVFDLRSYPGLERAAPAFQLSAAELERQLETLNPIARVSVLAKRKIPACFIHGDEDQVVPLGVNSAAFVEVYRQAGAESQVQLIVAKGQGHNYWEGFFRSPEVIDFVIARAKAGAAQPANR